MDYDGFPWDNVSKRLKEWSKEVVPSCHVILLPSASWRNSVMDKHINDAELGVTAQERE